MALNENARKWVEALRSGEFEKGEGHLTCGDRDCCLGVACKVYQREVGGLDVITVEPIGEVRYAGERSILPEQVRHWLGLSTRAGSYGRSASLLWDNDRGKTFLEIACIIESEPEGLFVGNE